MPAQLTVSFDVLDPEAVGGFWAALLDRPVVRAADSVWLPGSDTQVGLRFVAGDPGTGRPVLHLHLTSADEQDQQRTVEQALSLGGRHLDVGQRPEEGHVVLQDPGGGELCVIEPGNRFLAGTGRLAEVACDGGREVGLFWHEALGWLLVWDEGDETAVQSPAGGTKVAWGGPSEAEKTARNAQRFVVTTDDVAAETRRLLSLGATQRADDELADPGDNEFRLIALPDHGVASGTS